MKIIFVFLASVVAGALLWFVWKFRPLMSPGQAVRLNSGQLGDFDFQVWQRKNNSIFEPFATGLFIHKRGEPWRAFLLDFEDEYCPRVLLRKEAAGFVVIEDGQELGALDEMVQTFKRGSDGASFPGAALAGEPPSNWWQK